MKPHLLGTTAVMLAVLYVTTVHLGSRPAGAAFSEDDLRPPARLSETGLYANGRVGDVDPRNRAFSPQYPLWTDGAAKMRWVYLPPGATIDASNPDDWVLPAGTRFWKEFAFGTRKVETRMLWKVSNTRWLSASYAWNDEQTDATLAPAEGVPAVADVAPGRRHSIPAVSDCAACHESGGRVRPLGFDALQLSPDRDPNAIHGEPLAPGMVTLRTLVEEGVLTPPHAEWDRNPPRIRTSHPVTRSVLGYLVVNCGSCHNGNGEIAALGPVIRRSELVRDGDAVAASFAGSRTKWQVPGVADGQSVLVDPSSPDTSAILVRMRSRSPSSQMPPLGTVVRDREAVEAIAGWIALAPAH
jgi:cytochrome c553